MTDSIKNVKEKSESAYRTIGEVSKIVDVPQHILRFWESKFEQVNPKKKRGRRYYTPLNIENLKTIKFLLYEQGYTIKGVSQYLGQLKKNINSKPNTQLYLIQEDKQIRDNEHNGLEILLAKLKFLKSKLLATF